MVVDNTVQWLQLNLKETGLPVGFEYFTMNPNIPAGSLPLQGGLYSRLAYPDLWEWVQKQPGYLKTESEWQELAVNNGGNVPFYSKGDGATTFRVPSLKCWVKSGSSISEVGSYLEAGLPNILGSAGHFNSLIEYVYSGAMFEKSSKPTDGSNAGATQAKEIGFDASRSNKIYGSSDTVQPPSIIGLWCVKAYGTITNVGSTDVANISTGLAQAETRISSLETNKVDKAGNAWVVESYRNGAEWYRVWSDGWIEQGGVILFNSYSNIVQTITFPTAFTNTDYTFITNPIYNGDVNGKFIVEYTSDIYGKKDSRTTTSIQCAGGMSRSWYACGY